MKKVQILILTLLIGSVALFSFKSSTTATRYGGTGSVKITVYNKVYSSAAVGYVRGEKASSSTINVTESCSHYDKASATSAIEREISRQANTKTRALQEWDYDGSIDYRITSCD
jgi:hypothetical protein